MKQSQLSINNMDGSYVQWQKEVMEEVHKAVLKLKRVCDDKIVPVQW